MLKVEYDTKIKLYKISYKGYEFYEITREIALDTFKECIKLWNIK